MPTITRTYDIICFGDEVPGILALVCAGREYYRQKNQYPQTLLLLKGNSKLGIGGHLVRGGLSYLDRSTVPPAIRQSNNLDTFGDPPAIYKEFLQRAGVALIALDPVKADSALRAMLQEVRADIISDIEIKSVIKEGQKITAIELTKGETYAGKQFIDCTVNAELAQAAGVKKLKGFETFGLPDSELAVTLVFETHGLSIERLKNVEYLYLKRFTKVTDTEAQKWLNVAAGGNTAKADQLRKDLVDSKGNLKTMFAGKDYIDVRSKAFSIAYHAFRGTALSLESSGTILDNGNVAVLSQGRLSWNAVLYKVNADQAEALARAKAKPTPEMLREMLFVRKWFESIGASQVKPAEELYIRHAGNITGAVNPLSGSQMLTGGVPPTEALGTFGYHFDIRGGINGLDERAAFKGFNNLAYLNPPLFNIGIQHALMKNVPNLAVISPASGFVGYASSAGRIVEFNCGVGQGVGIAAGIAIAAARNLADISNTQVRTILAQTGRLSQVYGTSNTALASQLGNFENQMIA
ncbi:FAD-dependent oxidoreductase [Brasilonema sp. UFV-L1]|uniref:FAD-dependent oxidoreductase n=1 Tax=Brasilonema sp. UFV-L1 TaxID=2234130 RepID=UPI00145C4695|nr:FAD-dependent oxidoreductase [Brasilonema sp. UFV-L1]NMG08501.1 FAD-dependent oxidoreductase [Brasilonema sp. UFV-L1]